MPTETRLTSINLFNSQADYEANKHNLTDEDLALIPVNILQITSDGHVVLPDGSEFWIA